jgi:hypothetical protein
MTQQTGEVHRTGIKRELAVKLSFEDMLDVAINKTKLEDQVEKLETEFDLVKDKHKTDLAEVEAKIAALRAQLRTGERATVVECFERWKGNLLELVRTDTNQVVETRTATLKDTQPDLPSMAAAQADAAKAQAAAGVAEDDEGDVVPIEGSSKKKRGAR